MTAAGQAFNPDQSNGETRITKFKLPPGHILVPWIIRHVPWCHDRFQVKKNGKTWYVFDDETVAEVPVERIKELHGGTGDAPIAYMCLYRKMDKPKLDDEPDEKKKK